MSTTLRHIAGSVFGLMLSSEQCPIVDPSNDPIDTHGWGVKLRLVGNSYSMEIDGQWLETAGPWSISFEARETIAWPEQVYAARLAYIESGVGGRRFEVETPMKVEVLR